MSQTSALEHLAACVKRETNFRWHGQVGLSTLRAGADVKLVERALAIVLPWNPAGCLVRLVDPYTPIAWRVLAKTKHPEATFLFAYAPTRTGDGLRAGCRWLTQLNEIEKPTAKRIAALTGDASGVAAARATVAKHGAAIPQLFAILANDGAPPSAAVLTKIVEHAAATADETLDALFAYLVPCARGPKMKALATQVTRSRDARGAASSVQDLAARFGATTKSRFVFELSIDSRQVQAGLLRKAALHVTLSSHALPNVDVMVVRHLWNHKTTWFEDGNVKADDNKLGRPSTIDDLPRWIAASARVLKVSWDRDTLLVQSSLRGKARTAAVDWLLGG